LKHLPSEQLGLIKLGEYHYCRHPLTYLLEAAGTPQKTRIKNPTTDRFTGKFRKPNIIQENDPPINHTEALDKWNIACKNFRKILNKAQKELARLEEARTAIREL